MDDRDRKQVRLSDENAAFVENVVAAGEFASDEAVVGEALREWRERRDNFGYTIAELRRLVQDGIDSGSAVGGPPLLERIHQKYAGKVQRAGQQ